MKAKTIKSILRRKVQALANSINVDGEEGKATLRIRKVILENTVITGGSIASLLMNEPLSDFDIYFRNKQSVLEVANYYANQFKASYSGELDIKVVEDVNCKHSSEEACHSGCQSRVKIVVLSAGIANADAETAPESQDLSGMASTPEGSYQYFELTDPDLGLAGEYIDACLKAAGDNKEEEDGKFRPIFLSANAITLSDKVQLVLRFYGEPDEIHENYDFAHCMCYWQSWDGRLELPAEALECLLTKQLIYKGSRYPLCSVIRTRKFIERGFHINAGQYLKMLMQVSELDLTDVNVLEDQLTGVDVYYFKEIINAVKLAQKESGTDTVDSTYVAELVDRIF